MINVPSIDHMADFDSLLFDNPEVSVRKYRYVRPVCAITL